MVTVERSRRRVKGMLTNCELEMVKLINISLKSRNRGSYDWGPWRGHVHVGAKSDPYSKIGWRRYMPQRDKFDKQQTVLSNVWALGL